MYVYILFIFIFIVIYSHPFSFSFSFSHSHSHSFSSRFATPGCKDWREMYLTGRDVFKRVWDASGRGKR